MPALEVTDAADARLADFVGLRDADLRRRIEHERGIFIAEGITVVRRLLASPYPVRAVLVTPAMHTRLRPVLSDEITVLVTTA